MACQEASGRRRRRAREAEKKETLTSYWQDKAVANSAGLKAEQNQIWSWVDAERSRDPLFSVFRE